MPQLSNIVLKNNADADVTFEPRDTANGVATLVNKTGVPIADKQLSVSAVRTQAGRTKVTTKLRIPVVQDVDVNGVSKPTVVRTAYVDLVFSVDQTSDTTERADVVAYLKSFLGSTAGIAVMRDLSVLY